MSELFDESNGITNRFEFNDLNLNRNVTSDPTFVYAVDPKGSDIGYHSGLSVFSLFNRISFGEYLLRWMNVENKNGKTLNHITSQKIGSGGFSNVYQLTDGKTSYILKIAKRHQDNNGIHTYELSSILTELFILLKLRGYKYFLQLLSFQYFVSEDQQEQYACFLFPYKEGVELTKVIQFLYGSNQEKAHNQEKHMIRTLITDPDFIRNFLYGCIKGLLLLHHLNIIHRDIKPSNIWIDPKGNPMFLDVGVAYEMTNDLENVKIPKAGTENYMRTPIVTKHIPAPNNDYYSLSLTVQELYNAIENMNQIQLTEKDKQAFDALIALSKTATITNEDVKKIQQNVYGINAIAFQHELNKRQGQLFHGGHTRRNTRRHKKYKRKTHVMKRK
jgi:serine/threonine protein kinase